MIETPETFNTVLQRSLHKERVTPALIPILDARPAP